jgi:hypothetical protein
MRDFEELNEIICGLDDELFDRLNNNDWDAAMGDRNAKARFRRALKKAEITEDEWWLWAEA